MQAIRYLMSPIFLRYFFVFFKPNRDALASTDFDFLFNFIASFFVLVLQNIFFKTLISFFDHTPVVSFFFAIIVPFQKKYIIFQILFYSGITMVLQAIKLSLAVNGDVELQWPPKYASTLVRYLAKSLRAFKGRTLMTFRAGLALKTCSCLVNGLMPFRSGVAGF